MSEVKGTPGPWRCNDNEGSYRTLILGNDEKGQTHTIAEVYEQYDDTHQEHPHARLIAAAPELLEALQEFIGWATDCEELFDHRTYGESESLSADEGWAGLKDLARAAIAKALGQ